MGSDGTPRGNRNQNEQFRYLCNKYNIDKDTQERIHREIHGQNYSFSELEDIIKSYA